MTTYCIDENKNLVNTLAVTKREFTCNIEITSPVKEDFDQWGFQIEYDTNLISFLNVYKDNILSTNLSGTLIDTGVSIFPAWVIYNPSASSVNIRADISLNGYDGSILYTLTPIISLVSIDLDGYTTTPNWVQGETYTLVTTFYITS